MSKKFYFIFSILVFAILFSFIGCTDLLNPKTQTDINLNIDLSKIIKSSRNEGGSQGASSLGDNPTIKVAIYDAKDYDKATNSTENLTLITQAQASVGGDGIARVKLSDIPVGIDAIVFAELSFTDENSTQVVYAGNSGVFKVKASDNKVSLVLKKVANSETSPDNTNTPYENYTLYKKTENGEEVSNVTGATISTSSTSETKVTVKNPEMSDSVWTYFVKPENKTRFTKSGNYKVSVELKADKTTVVGIAAARADYFFTVNSDWTTCEFNTGYLIGNEKHQFTIGLGLSSEIQIKNLKIEKLSEIDTTEPSLVFDISKDAIETYIGKDDRPEKIIDVSKLEGNAGYNITINTPLSHKESTDATVQYVKLHLRSYATENTGANNVSFNITNTGIDDFETSVMADTANEKSTAWNNNASPISASSNSRSFSVDFPNYKANDELIVDLITSSTSTSQNNSTSFTLSNFKVGIAEDPLFSDKIFAIQIDKVWTKIDNGDPISKEVTIGEHKSINFDVVLFNKDVWDETSGIINDEEKAWKEATRFVLDGDDIASDLAENFIYSTLSNESGNPIYNLKNDFDEDKTVQIKLNENYEVVIEEVAGTTITSWTDLSNQIAAINDAPTATEFVITDNLTATSIITISKPIKITANNDVTITRGSGFLGVFFAIDTGSLELGSNENKIILDGGNQSSTNYGGAVYVSGGTFTMNDGVTIRNCNATDGGAIYITDGGTFNMNGGTITECSATTDGGAVYITDGGTFTMNDDATIIGCTATLSGGGVWMNGGSSFTMQDRSKIERCTATRTEGGGVYVTDANSNFKMISKTSISNCLAGMDGGGVSYGCGTSEEYNFTMQDNASISNCSANGNGGGVYLYGNLVMNGGTISGCSASSGAGVYVRNDNDVLSSLSVSGNAIVNSNFVYLTSGTTVKVAGNLTNNIVATIKLDSYTEGTQVLTAENGVPLAKEVSKFALADTSGEFTIGEDGKIATKVISLTNDYLNNIKDNNQYRYTLSAGEYCVTENLSIQYPIVIDGNVSIYSNGDYTISVSENYNSNNSYSWLSMIAIPSGSGPLTLGNETGNLTIDGTKNSNTTLDYLVMSSGTFNLSDNVTITNGVVKYGAVYVGGGTFNMTGGEIKNNKATQSSYSGIYVLGDINIEDGSICDNYVGETNNGASIYNQKSDNITVLGQNISASGGYFTKNIIEGKVEEVATGGGGSSVTIYTDYAELKNAISTISTGKTETFYISGDITSTSTTITVKGNITLLATEEGASICRSSTFTSESLFTIERSASLVLGGTSSGQLVIDGSNVEVSYPLINSSGSLEIGEHCILQNNNNVISTKKGGAIYEYCTSGDAPTLKISGGKIQNCNAKAGGAIYIEGSESCVINFDFSGGEISNNYAKGNGGAVYLNNTSGTLSGTIIKNNYAQLTSPGSTAGGGGIYVTKSTLNMTAGSIENNTTNSYGGGVYVNTKGIFNITGGDIKENATNSATDSMNIYAYGTVTINEIAVPTAACNQNIINGVLTDQTSSYEFTDFVE